MCRASRGATRSLAGRMLMPLFLAWAISVAVAARAVVHRGFRFGALIGSSLITMGSLGLVLGTVFPEWYRFGFYPGLVLVGLGMGPTSLSLILAVQHSVSWGQRGVATGAVILLRTIGGALGVGLLGAALGWELAYRLASVGASGIDVTAALRPETHKLLTPDQLAIVQAQLGNTLRDVYFRWPPLGSGRCSVPSGCPTSTRPSPRRRLRTRTATTRKTRRSPWRSRNCECCAEASCLVESR